MNQMNQNCNEKIKISSLQSFGDGSVAQRVLSNGANGDFFAINWGFAVAVMMGVYVSAGVSGGHLNPAVSLALAISGKLSWKKIPYYMLGQYIGAFLGAASVYFVYYGKLLKTYPFYVSKFEVLYLYR